MTYRHAKDYEERIGESIVDFMHQNHQRHRGLRYEDLIQEPRESTAALNGFLDTHLTVEDLKSVYPKPLSRNRRTSALNDLKAVLIYLTNYSERKDLSTP